MKLAGPKARALSRRWSTVKPAGDEPAARKPLSAPRGTAGGRRGVGAAENEI